MEKDSSVDAVAHVDDIKEFNNFDRIPGSGLMDYDLYLSFLGPGIPGFNLRRDTVTGSQSWTKISLEKCCLYERN
jgi:hypothetical protein